MKLQRILFGTIVAICSWMTLCAQKSLLPEINLDTTQYHFIDTLPHVSMIEPAFPGGVASMVLFIKSNFKTLENEFSLERSKILVQFVVEKDGTISNIMILRGVSPELDEEVRRVIQIMPKWIPGTLREEPQRCTVVLPFQICYR